MKEIVRFWMIFYAIFVTTKFGEAHGDPTVKP